MNRYIVTCLAFLASMTAAHADQVLKGRPGAERVIVWTNPDAAADQSGMPLILRPDVACLAPVGALFEPLPMSTARTLNDAFKPAPVMITAGPVKGCHGFIELEDLRSNG